MSAYVVKATDRDGTVAWLSPVHRLGARTLTAKSDAAVFSTREQAEMAIRQVPLSFTEHGITFEIEPSD